VIYLCAGDPDLETTSRLIVAAAKAGADVIEIGMPFSDPTADGVAIQKASERALARGTSLRGLLDAVRRARRETDVPFLLFGYYNPILAYGEQKLVGDAAEAGIDGFLVVDLPPEECEPLRAPAVERGLDYVPLVAPTSNQWRVELAASAATAFIYYVSVTGVTGAKGADIGAAAERAAAVSRETGMPVALGFGVKTPDDVAAAAKHVQGVVVGTAIVRAIESASSADAAVEAVRQLVSTLAAASGRAAS
jgi:tryptophan synthase alpha chain